MNMPLVELVPLLALAAACLAFVLFCAVSVAIRRASRFSLRDMFVATTAAAVLIWLTIKCLT
jgi:hypothetical protein